MEIRPLTRLYPCFRVEERLHGIVLIQEIVKNHMSDDRIIPFVIGAVGTTIVALVVIIFFDALLASPAALKPGDTFYPQQRALVQTVSVVLPWLVPGAIGAAVVVLASLRDGF